MAKKRSLAPPVSPTDEWGIYDPSKAGMEALYSRLGRPILRAADGTDRRRRRRGSFRAERPADGVGMAIQEARRRATQMSEALTAPPVVPAVPEVPATPPAAAPPAVMTAVDTAEAATPAVTKGRAKTAKSARRKLGAALDAAGARADGDAGRVGSAPVVPVEAPPRRAARAAGRGRAIAREKAVPPVVAAAPAVPLPSPRRPRGPVPLAAWAHAVSDTLPAESRRPEAKGLWRGIFRIPTEVALVEYGRGCRIHRLVIEGGTDAVVDPF